MLELHETIRLPNVVSCPIVFILFYDQNWQQGLLKLTKKAQFYVFLDVWTGLKVAYVKTGQNHKSATLTEVSNCFYLAL